MSDVRELFRRLADDVAGPVPAASEVRRAADRRRVVGRLKTAAAGLALTLAAVGVARALTDEGRPRVPHAVGVDASTPPSGATRPDRAWLPEPWDLVDSDADTWAPGAVATYRFCGVPLVSHGVVHVAEQVLVHPSGQRAHLFAFTPEAGGPMELFKFSYASCLAPGDAASVAGPRNLWTYAGAAAGSEMVGGSLHLVEVRPTAAGAVPTRRDVATVLDAWAHR